MVIVASFYAPRPALYPNAVDYRPLLALLDKSCARFGLEHYCITDPEAAPGIGCNTFAATMQQSLMPAFFEGQAQFLASWAARGRNVILVGADCLVNRDPAPLFDGSFDIMVTSRQHERWPINTGAVYIHASTVARMAAMYGRMAKRCGHQWGDDQIEIARMLGPVPVSHGDYHSAGLRVRFAPMKRFNDTPKALEQVSDAYIVHFKGPRKHMVADWARLHMSLE